ncbi:MAG: ABC transporter ATP-binding protein [Desulfosarcina sp.]|nr:ABC transporter ATP-binding protein [Desulfosarcina sp.]MBC2741789.1 ABC transporter ATP-binding protein [Desulfosarcina sp.]MBC2764703.1 ABC transporter ATP-binding protein [Desulfosarcina sp.]
MTSALLEVDNLSIGYRTAGGISLAVDGVSFRVDRGGSLGLVGESGCGKTTIGMGLMGLLAPNATIVSGQVRFEGEDLMTASDARMRQIRWRRISMIFQAAMNALNPVHRVQDQIAEAIITHEPDLSGHSVAHRTRSLFDLVKIPESRLQDYPHQFSGGMRQRVIIAMALACNPSLIIADEPTTALDVIVQNQILSAIGTFQEEMNIGMIFISHDIAVVADVCTNIGVMHAGSLVEYGSRQEVLDCPGHPYTRMLVGSLLTLSDQPADLSGVACAMGDNGPATVEGCPINSICPDATAVCRRERAGWVELSTTHRVRCSQAGEGR